MRTSVILWLAAVAWSHAASDPEAADSCTQLGEFVAAVDDAADASYSAAVGAAMEAQTDFLQIHTALALRGTTKETGASQASADGAELGASGRTVSVPVHVLLSADANWLEPTKVVVSSAVLASKAPSRLNFHIAVLPEDAAVYQAAFQNSTRQLRGASLSVDVTKAGNDAFEHLFPKNYVPFKGQPRSSEVRHRMASNYMRFFIDDFVPEDASVGLWLDSDTVIRSDLADLADAMLAQPNKTIGFARRRCYAENGILEQISDHDWARANVDKLQDGTSRWLNAHNAGIVAFNLQRWRQHRVRERGLELISESSQRAMPLYVGGSQMPLVLGSLLQPGPPMAAMAELGEEWNCFISSCTPWLESEMRKCNIVHYSGAMKPWEASGKLMVGADLWWQARAAAAKQISGLL